MDKELLLSELKFKAVRSSGAGGQHVNKVSSKVELTFGIVESQFLSEPEKKRILSKLKSRLTKEGVLILFCDESRSQHKNRELVVQRFLELMEKAVAIPKKRKKTKPKKSAIEKRLKDKRKSSEKKGNRKKPDVD